MSGFAQAAAPEEPTPGATKARPGDRGVRRRYRQRLARRWRAQRDRMRLVGLRGFLHLEPATLRRLIKATVAAMVAWEVADLLHSPRPALASLAAILVVQVTVRATLARSIQLTIGVTAGLVLSVALGHLLGLHWWTIGLIVLGGLIVGELLRLGPFASQAAISALLAFSLGSAYGILRVTDTVVGAVIGVAVNALIAPPSYVAETSTTLRRVGEDLGDLLMDIGEGLADGLHAQDPPRWLERARSVAADLHAASDSLDRAEESVRFNPLTRSSEDHLERLAEARLALEHASSQVRGMARALGDLTVANDRGAGVATGNVPTGNAPISSAPPSNAPPSNAPPSSAPTSTAPVSSVPTGSAPPSKAPTSSDAKALSGVVRQFGLPLVEAGHAVAAFGRLQEDPSSVPNREQAIRAGAAAGAGQAVVVQAVADLSHRELLSPSHLLLASSVLVDVDRLIREVDVERGSHAAAVAAF